jgi:glycosyltransferase involved in cell wall biosynthesis
VPSTELSILVPVLSRPQNVDPTVDSVFDATEGVPFEIVFITSYRDTAEVEAIDAAIERLGPVIRRLDVGLPHAGDYARKINYGYLHTTSPWLFLSADDVRYEPDWFREAMRTYHRTGCRVIGTQDLGNARVIRGEHSTHTLVHRTYVEECGTIDEVHKVLHEGYPHEFVDDEFVETAKARHEFAFCNEAVVEHLHPIWGKAPTDRLYDAHRKRMNQGRRIYMKRRRLWGGR